MASAKVRQASSWLGSGSDVSLEIGEFRREQGAPFRAWRTVVHGRRIGLRIHGVKSPKPGAGKGDNDNHRFASPGLIGKPCKPLRFRQVREPLD